jgi:hypothetical protein
MPKKPKGWYHRYEIVQRLRDHPSGTPRWRWEVVHYLGRNRGASVRGFRYGGEQNLNLTDEAVIRAADCQDVTVPVYVIRDVDSKCKDD